MAARLVIIDNLRAMLIYMDKSSISGQGLPPDYFNIVLPLIVELDHFSVRHGSEVRLTRMTPWDIQLKFMSIESNLIVLLNWARTYGTELVLRRFFILFHNLSIC